jgi:hypothetical protein
LTVDVYILKLTPMTPRTRVNYYLDEELVEGLKQLKARVGVPESESVRRAVAEYLERQGVPVAKVKAERKRAATRRRP